MKSTIKIFLSAALSASLLGCAKDLTPKDQLQISTTFSDYNGFKIYAWKFYNVFPGYAFDGVNSEINGDLFLNANPNGQSAWISQTVVVPSSDAFYTNSYARIRDVNIMLDNIGKTTLSDADKAHWRSVGYFFRAFNYAGLVNRYGDVQYLDHAPGDADTALYMARTPRDIVTQHILDDLNYAQQNIKVAGDGDNTVNKAVVQAFLSRFGLQEGTWRKYHNLGNAEPYLRASALAAEKLMVTFPALSANYDDDFNSENLGGVPGIILYKQYVTNQITHSLSSYGRNSSGRWDLTKKAIDMYLLKDGQSRFTSPLFTNDKTPNDEFKNRDLRLYFSVPPPYKVNTNPPSNVFTYTGVPEDTMYFGVMNRISNAQRKTLPTLNWNGFVVRQEPHYADYSNGQPYCVTYTGYRFYKFVDHLVLNLQNSDINDCPVFRMGEVLANYAEAKFELGEFTQAIANATINKLRARGEVAALDVAAIANDPSRDPDVDPVLWEIRRERAVELMGEGFHFDDLRRWNKMSYVTQWKLGRWIKKGTDVPANSIIPVLNGATEGYISYEPLPPATFPDYYYLYPIPSGEIALNPKLTQNPGWPTK
ncbi:RagB/SusD family nutrient uptake outer membrane protein [Chitinophagaceae bacterium 26-R-25]|nr:RagB/SusD family nutrient uptake outer membrane protein [Chitinophagaceae bacterium 26-R-25]